MNVICVDFPMSPKVMKEFKKRFKYKYDMTLAVLFRLSVNLIERPHGPRDLHTGPIDPDHSILTPFMHDVFNSVFFLHVCIPCIV